MSKIFPLLKLNLESNVVKKIKCKNTQYEPEAVHEHISAEKLSTHSNLVFLPGIYFTSKYALFQCVLEKKMGGAGGLNHKMD